MRKKFVILCLAIVILCLAIVVCTEDDEESATQYDQNDTFDQVRGGARLILRYDVSINAFTGTIENTTGSALSNVRIEVHLSNGAELGPTPPIELISEQTVSVNLPATAEKFTTWVAHAEVGERGGQ